MFHSQSAIRRMRSQFAADGTTQYSSLMLSSYTYAARDRITNRTRKPYGDGEAVT